jgi:hypothetical protein
LPSESDPALLGFPDSIDLPLRAYLRLELGNGTQHVKQQASGGITRVNVLIEDLEMDVFALQDISDLTQMQRGACQPIEAGHDERITFPHIIQACIWGSAKHQYATPGFQCLKKGKDTVGELQSMKFQ